MAIAVVVLGLSLADRYRDEEKRLRRSFREHVKEQFPEQTAAFSEYFGLFPFPPEREPATPHHPASSSVVLVHGLDDPGKVWRNLAPVLVEEGHRVWLMRYPNDQPVVESALFFFDALKTLSALGVRHISIVAHSMGGLVSREMLTRPTLAYADAARRRQVPAVERLIMVGTPNHGSPLARFRVLGEVRDHMARLQKGEASWIGAILDGAGEAKIDLLPGSRFLTELNARPHPTGVAQMIIAGISSPWDESDIQTWKRNWKQGVTDDLKGDIDALAGYLIAMARGLGDGLVSVESTRLEGVPHRVVEGTHLTIIRNLVRSSRRVPPAVPIIVDRLRSEG